MGRFSPTVTPSGASPLAAALSGGTSGLQLGLQEKRRREREERRRRAEERRQERQEQLQRLREIRMARQGFRPEDATTEAVTRAEGPPTEADRALGGVTPGGRDFAAQGPSSPVSGGAGIMPGEHDLRAGNLSSPVAFALSQQLRGARGESAPRAFVPGDVREQPVETARIPMEQAPGRIPLPSGGSIPEVSPEQQREQAQQERLREALIGAGVGPARAEVITLGGPDPGAPEAGEPEPFTADELVRRFRISPERARRLEGFPRKMQLQEMRELIGPEDEGDVSVEETEGFDRATRFFIENPNADVERVADELGFSISDAVEARDTAREAREQFVSQNEQAIIETLGAEPANEMQRMVVRHIARTGSIKELRAEIDRSEQRVANSSLSNEEKRDAREKIVRLRDALEDLIARSEFRDPTEADRQIGQAVRSSLLGIDTDLPRPEF